MKSKELLRYVPCLLTGTVANFLRQHTHVHVLIFSKGGNFAYFHPASASDTHSIKFAASTFIPVAAPTPAQLGHDMHASQLPVSVYDFLFKVFVRPGKHFVTTNYSPTNITTGEAVIDVNCNIAGSYAAAIRNNNLWSGLEKRPEMRAHIVSHVLESIQYFAVATNSFEHYLKHGMYYIFASLPCCNKTDYLQLTPLP